MIELRAGASVLAMIEPQGSRVRSLLVDGHQLLAAETAEALLWGCYPMVPWAGRLGGGTFRFEGRTVRLPRDFGDHAIHGLGLWAEWSPAERTDPQRAELSLDLTERWPFGGTASTVFALDEGGLSMTVAYRATTTRAPVIVGWHPCFARSSVTESPTLGFAAASWWRRGEDGLPVDEQRGLPPHPWDDCFTGVRSAPQLHWPDFGGLRLESATDTWVVFDGHPHAICVEPQTGPPNGFNLARCPTVEPGDVVSLTLRLTWRRR